MKTLLRWLLACVAIALAAPQSHAQSVVQTITISLSGLVQAQSQNDNGTNTISTAAHTSVTSASVIQALGASLGLTFDSKAVLEAVSDTSGNLDYIVVLDDGKTNDVTSFFTVNPGNFITSGRINDASAAGTQTQYGTEEFVLTIGGGLSFDVQGLTTISSTITFSATTQATTTVSQTTAAVSGTGTAANGNTTVLKGTISIRGHDIASAGG